MKNTAIAVNNDTFKFNGIKFNFWKSREILGNIKSASISQDSQNKWYINITTDYQPELYSGDGLGIPLLQQGEEVNSCVNPLLKIILE